MYWLNDLLFIALLFFIFIALPVGLILLIGYVIKSCIREAKKPYNPDDQNRF